MTTIRNSSAANVAISLILSVLTIAAGASTPNAGGKTLRQKDQKEQALVQVEPQYVCMVNNQRFNKKLISVEVGGQTYYGCCEMCTEKLRNNPKSHVAVDPVSGKEVDKAKAVIGADPDGKVFYFESVENLKQFKLDSKSTQEEKKP